MQQQRITHTRCCVLRALHCYRSTARQMAAGSIMLSVQPKKEATTHTRCWVPWVSRISVTLSV